MQQQNIGLGRIVHVCIGVATIGELPPAPIFRPALVVRVWTPESCNVVVSLDGTNDDRPYVRSLHQRVAAAGGLHSWETSVLPFDAEHPEDGGWIWPPRV